MQRKRPRTIGVRFTPTGVGTIFGIRFRRSSWAVHPHGRGDNRARQQNGDAHRGSPPRAWGQWYRTSFAHISVRFTPTGVGTICWRRRGTRRRTVHPHGRGDNFRQRNVVLRPGGSPPRAWGQYERAIVQLLTYRFTPTGVGTMTPCARCRWRNTVHPHGRGDNRCAAAVFQVFFGSPPRAWGQYAI